MKISDKLKKIRSLMKNLSIDCYLIPHSDEFSNEFLPPYSRRLEWISDFTGSAGDVIILSLIHISEPTRRRGMGDCGVWV